MIRISHSLRTAYRQCPRQVFFRYHAGIVKRFDTSPALVIGKAFHRGLELLRKGETMVDAVNLVSTQFLLDSKDVMDIDKRLENEVKLRAYLLGYDLFFNDGAKTFEPELQVDGDNTIAFIDGVYVQEGRAVIVEDKTTAAFNVDMDKLLAVNEQTLWYWSELDRIGYDVAAISFRETKKSAHRVNKKEELSEFKKRIADIYLGGQELCYRELNVTYSSEQVLAYRKMIRAIDDDLRRNCDSFTDDFTGVLYNGFSCSGKYNSCAYLGICSGQNNVHNNYVLRSEYEPWDGGVFASKCGIEALTQEDLINE